MRAMRLLSLASLPFLFASTAASDGLTITPGLWKSTSTVFVRLEPLDPPQARPAPEIRTSESCISSQARVLEAEHLAGPGCQPSDVTATHEGLSLVLVCQRANVTLYGTMTATAHAAGTTTAVHMTLTGRRADGREIQITAETRGQRLGPCGAP